jgi:hypothetical protein
MIESRKLSKIDREIATALVETKAVNFEALGKVVAKFGAESMLMDDDGWIRWCGSDLRLYRWPRGKFGLEDIRVLRDMLHKDLLHDINVTHKL